MGNYHMLKVWCFLIYEEEHSRGRALPSSSRNPRRLGRGGCQRSKFLDKNAEKAEKRKYLHEALIAYKKENPCVDCGEMRIPALQFDHIDPSNKIMEVSKMVSQVRSLDMIMREVSKCEVRCVNCHTRRTAEQFGWNEGVDMSVD